MEGTLNIKIILAFVLDFVADAQKAMADGKFQITDSFLFIDNVIQVPKAIGAAKQFYAEFEDMDATEEADVLAYVSERLQVNSVKAKAIAMQSFKTAITISELVGDGIELAAIIKAA